VAGLLKLAQAERVERGQQIVVTVTGHGLKDVDTASAHYGEIRPYVIPADVSAAAEVLGLK
jgi:threonine synthase